MKKIPDEEIIKQLQYGDQSSINRALAYLHQQIYRQVANFMTKHQGTANDTEDIFQDSLLAFYKLARKGALKKNTNVEAYLFTICKNLWFLQLRKRKDTIALEDLPFDTTVAEVTLFSLVQKEEQVKVRKLISKIGSDCQKVLRLYYYQKFRMKEIAERMNYSSEQVAKNKKSGCLKKLKDLMLNDPFFKNRIV